MGVRGVSGVVATLIAVAPASQPRVPLAAYAGVCVGACGRSSRRSGAVVGLPLREGCTDGADIGVAVCGAADGSSGPGVVSFVLAWEEAVEEPDAVAPAVLVCASSAARRARSVGGSMVGIGVQSVRGLFVRRRGSAAGDICRRCLPPGSSGLLSSSAWNVTRRAAEGGVRLWCRALVHLLDLCGGCGV